MSEHVEHWLPFYANDTLTGEQKETVQQHLQTCAACQHSYENWQRIARQVRVSAQAHSRRLPELSPLVKMNLRQRPSLTQALQSAFVLIWSQRVVLMRNGLVPLLALAILAALFTSLLLGDPRQNGYALPFLVTIPVVAVLAVAFLHTPDSDLAYEIIHSTPTATWTILFARLTLVLACIGGLALVGSLTLSATGPQQLWSLIAVWLGPTLAFSALATVLALQWRPLVAAGISLTLWGSLVSLQMAELQGRPLMGFSLQSLLLHPGGYLVFVQIVLAGLLWFTGLIVLSRREPANGYAGGEL
jgi:hypothetical protein